MNRSKVGQYTKNSGKPVLKQRSIASFFSQTKRSHSITKTHNTITNQSVQKKSNSVSTNSFFNSKKSLSNLTEGSCQSQPIIIEGSRPQLSRTSTTSLFQSQGSFDEYDPNEELRKLMNGPKLKNFKSPNITSFSRVPNFQRSNSSVSDLGSASPTKIEHVITEISSETFRETTSIATPSHKLIFTSSTQLESPTKSDYFSLSQAPELSSEFSTLSSSSSSSFPTFGSSHHPNQLNSSKRTRSLQGLNLNTVKRLKPLSNSNPRAIQSNNKQQSNKNNSIILKLTKEQQYVIDLVVQKRQNIFYTGSAGTGKSIILNNIIHNLQRIYGKEAVAITASTGLAAATIGGITLHKWSHTGIGNRSAEVLARAISKRRDATMTWRNTKVLIIDEISMIDGKFLSKLEYIARVVRKNDKPFGGIQLVFTGDFFQLPPVSKSITSSDSTKGNSNGEAEALFCFESEAWKKCIQKTILLTKVFRQQDNELIDILNCIRFGEIEQKMIASIKKLEREVKYEDGILPTEIYATRREVDLSNKRQLENLPGDPHTFHAEDLAPRMKLELLDSAVMAEKTLVLKEDAQVMMLKNKPDVEVFNGTLGKVLFFTTQRLATKFLEMFHTIDRTTIEDMRLVSKAIHNKRFKEVPEFMAELKARDFYHHGKLEEMVNYAMNESAKEPAYPFVRWSIGKGKFYHELVLPEPFPVDLPGEATALQRTQLPIMLCWALSIHKAQGQTIPRLKVDLKNIFEAGQVYVALSRAVSKECLQVKNFNPRKIRSNDKVKKFYKGLETVTQF